MTSDTHRRSGVEAARTGAVEVVVVAALRLVVQAAVLQAVAALLPVLARVGVVGDTVGDLGVMDKTGAKKRRSPYAVRLSGVESL